MRGWRFLQTSLFGSQRDEWVLHVEAGKPTEYRHVEASPKGKMQSWAMVLGEGSSAIATPGFYALI